MTALLYRLLLAYRVLETAVLAPVWLVRTLIQDWRSHRMKAPTAGSVGTNTETTTNE